MVVSIRNARRCSTGRPASSGIRLVWGQTASPETEEISWSVNIWNSKVPRKYKWERDSRFLWNPMKVNSLFSKKAVKAVFKAEVSHQVRTRTKRGFVISGSDPLGMNKIEGCVILITFFCTFQSPLCAGHKTFNLIRDRTRRPCYGFGFEELHKSGCDLHNPNWRWFKARFHF